MCRHPGGLWQLKRVAQGCICCVPYEKYNYVPRTADATQTWAGFWEKWGRISCEMTTPVLRKCGWSSLLHRHLYYSSKRTQTGNFNSWKKKTKMACKLNMNMEPPMKYLFIYLVKFSTGGWWLSHQFFVHFPLFLSFSLFVKHVQILLEEMSDKVIETTAQVYIFGSNIPVTILTVIMMHNFLGNITCLQEKKDFSQDYSKIHSLCIYVLQRPSCICPRATGRRAGLSLSAWDPVPSPAPQ